ncbi:DUF551 domain-containing protein [Castellaniella sp. UC4442_H9]
MTFDTQKLRDVVLATTHIKPTDAIQFPNRMLERVNELARIIASCCQRIEALDTITQSTAAALVRHGVTEADDPGEAIDVLIADKDREIKRLREAQTWQPIESAPIGKNTDGMVWLLLAWGPECDQSIGSGFRWRDKWFAAATFYRFGQDRSYELREAEVRPTHWMPLPAGPAALSGDNP